jgi:hypothetical protein
MRAGSGTKRVAERLLWVPRRDAGVGVVQASLPHPSVVSQPHDASICFGGTSVRSPYPSLIFSVLRSRVRIYREDIQRRIGNHHIAPERGDRPRVIRPRVIPPVIPGLSSGVYRFESLKDASHWLLEEAADRVVPLLLEHLDANRETSPLTEVSQSPEKSRFR